jgi:hypothetical protein
MCPACHIKSWADGRSPTSPLDDLNKDYKVRQSEDAPPEETAEEKRAAKKRAERANMSEKELKKAEELDKKREFRKMQKKQSGK